MLAQTFRLDLIKTNLGNPLPQLNAYIEQKSTSDKNKKINKNSRKIINSTGHRSLQSF